MKKKKINSIASVVAVIVFLLLFLLLRELPSPTRLTSSERYNVTTQIFDRHGELLYEIYADENRVPIYLKDLPPYIAEATVAIEDERFYHHLGVDAIGVFRALLNNLRGKSIQGGSTITQQLVKNALLTKERTISRKAKEAVLAVLTEIVYSKKDILEMYLNYVSYGGTAVGIESAAKQYFGKSAKDLSLAEAALLAGLPQAPSRYSPFASDATAAKKRQEEVLDKMKKQKYISDLEAENAKGEILQYAISRTDIKAPHFVFFVRDLLYQQYGVETVEKGGLRVTTTLDLSLQETAQASLSAEVDRLQNYRVSNGAAMVIKPNTGEILAMIGSKDYFDNEHDGQVNVALALRQPGSSIKPLMYATAFQEKVLNPGTVLLDAPTCFAVINQANYCPKNYDGSFRGPVSVRDSLGNSLNIPAVKALKALGLETFIKQANAMGISNWQDPSKYGLSLTLGGGEVRMIDLAQAFAVLANKGIKVPVVAFLEIKDYKGKSLYQLDLEQRAADFAVLAEYKRGEKSGELSRVMDQAPAYLAAHIMQDNQARTAAFGPRSELVIPGQIVSAKTGTTNNLKDNWTVGFTPEYLTIAWVGNNDSSPMNPYLVSGVTGAAPIWHDIMAFILRGQEPLWPEKPDDVKSAPVCATGMPPEKCEPRYTELFWEEGVASRSKVEKRNTWIKADTGLPPATGESEEELVLEEHSFYTDPIVENYCLDCRRAVDAEGKTVYEKNLVH